MNFIVCPLRNNLHLTRKAFASFRSQDVPGGVEILAVNNASTDGTTEWLTTQRDVLSMYFDPPCGVAESWNRALQYVFRQGAQHALVVNNDVELRPDTYRWLLADGGGFVTAVGVRDAEKIKPLGQLVNAVYTGDGMIAKGAIVDRSMIKDGKTEPYYHEPDPSAVRPHPDFSCFLIRRETYFQVGPFDENFLCAFGEDWDYHVRLHLAKINAHCIDLPFLHHGSMTIKNAEPKEVRRIQIQAEKNREYFRKKWGMRGASEEYYKFFGSSAPVED